MSTRSDLLVNAVELARQPGTRKHIDLSIPLADLGVDDPRISGDVDVDLTLESTLDDIVVSGVLSVAWSGECRRCLCTLSDRLRLEVEERYAESADDDHRTPQPGDLDLFPIVNGQIDLRPMVREELLLAVPDAPLCRDDCPGLCPTCGADLSNGLCGCETDVRDERWAALDQLREHDLGGHGLESETVATQKAD